MKICPWNTFLIAIWKINWLNSVYISFLKTELKGVCFQLRVSTAYLTSLPTWLWYLNFKSRKGGYGGIHVILLNCAIFYLYQLVPPFTQFCKSQLLNSVLFHCLSLSNITLITIFVAVLLFYLLHSFWIYSVLFLLPLYPQHLNCAWHVLTIFPPQRNLTRVFYMAFRCRETLLLISFKTRLPRIFIPRDLTRCLKSR